MTRNYGLVAFVLAGLALDGAIVGAFYEMGKEIGVEHGFTLADPAKQYQEGLCDGLRMTRLGKPDLPECVGVMGMLGKKP